MLLGIPSGADCDAHATALNALMDACGGGSGSHVSCATRPLLPGFTFLDGGCTRTLDVSNGINSVMETYAEVYPSNASLAGGGANNSLGVECGLFSDLLRASAPDECDATSRVLNAAITQSTSSSMPFFDCGAPTLPLAACGNGLPGWCVLPHAYIHP